MSRRKVPAARVRRELAPGQSEALLAELHLLTRTGHLNADALRKLKQVNHLVGLLGPALEEVLSRYPSPVLVDAGSGNAYLGFVLYELFLRDRPEARLYCVESNAALCERARERAERLGFSGMRFVHGALAEVELPERVHLVTALHACDTATDDALARAVVARADHVGLVPCCQAEVARQLKEGGSKAREGVRALYARPWHRRELGAHLTNVVRALTLESMGYQVTVTELTGWEHSLKNELILGRRVHRESRDAKRRLAALLAEWPVHPAAVRLLGLAAPEAASGAGEPGPKALAETDAETGARHDGDAGPGDGAGSDGPVLRGGQAPS